MTTGTTPATRPARDQRWRDEEQLRRDDAAVHMTSAVFLAQLRAGGVDCCDEDDPSGWVDDSSDRIRDALLAAGWTPPRAEAPDHEPAF